MRKSLSIAALAVVLTATPGFGQPAGADEGVANAASAATAQPAGGAETKRADQRKYCLNIIPDTGSRTARRTCKTKQEWSDQGVEISAKN